MPDITDATSLTVAIYALAIAYLLSGLLKRVIDRLMPPEWQVRQIELLKSIDSRLAGMNGAIAKTLGVVEANQACVKELKETFVPWAKTDMNGVPRWWCHWPRIKNELFALLAEIRDSISRAKRQKEEV